MRKLEGKPHSRATIRLGCTSGIRRRTGLYHIFGFYCEGDAGRSEPGGAMLVILVSMIRSMAQRGLLSLCISISRVVVMYCSLISAFPTDLRSNTGGYTPITQSRTSSHHLIIRAFALTICTSAHHQTGRSSPRKTCECTARAMARYVDQHTLRKPRN